jgi:hypothetical protein
LLILAVDVVSALSSSGTGAQGPQVGRKEHSTLAAASPIVDWEYDQIQPAVAFSQASGGYLVVWEDHRGDGGNDSDIYGRLVDENNVAMSFPFAISLEGGRHRLAPDVACNSTAGEFLVVWEYAFSDTDHDIYARRVGSDGTMIGPEFPIADSPNFESNPSVAYDDMDNQYVIVWEQSGGEVSSYDIYGQCLT